MYVTGPADGEGKGGGGSVPGHVFENYKELLRKSVFIPPTSSH